jgi:hypothetical protein
MLLGAPARAAAPSVAITTPSNGQTLKDGTPTIQGSASMERGVINDVTVTISSDGGGDPVPPPYRLAGDDRASVTFSWTPSISHNGRYEVVARATGEDRPVDTNGEEVATSTRSFAVEAPPSTPRGVKASVNENTRVVTVKWTPNGEPDMIGYQVQRAVGESSDWAVAGESRDTSYEDKSTADAGGTYKYRVVAVREGAAEGSGVTSNPSSSSEVVVPAAPPPTTAVENPGNGGDGGGNNGGGDGGGSGTTTSTVPGDSPDPDGSNTGGGGGTTTTSRPSSSQGPVIQKAGKVDLSGFNLLDQTKVPQAQSTPGPDEGFSEQLPFGARPTPDDEEGEGGIAAGRIPLTDDESDRRVMLTFLAAGLLATVLLMHVLWIKGEVDRPVLEPLPPERPKEPGRLKAPGR